MTPPPNLRNALRSSRLVRWLYYDLHLADVLVLLGLSKFKKKSLSAMRQFMKQSDFNDNKLYREIYGDIRSCYFKYKTTPLEYFLFRLRGKTEEERRSYLSDSMIMKYAADKNGRRIHDRELNNKYNFYKINSRFFKRNAILLDRSTTLQQFMAFAHDQKRIIAKPNRAALGSGVEIFTIETNKEAEKIYNHLKESECDEYILEDVIIQDTRMAVWNQSCVNTIRINTFLNNGHYNVLSPFIRTGRKGSIVDNGGQGGIFASIDRRTGIVNTNGMDEFGNIYTRHPDSNIEYVGWQVPEWSKLMAIAEEIHCNNMPNHAYVSWDFALAEGDGWVLIEGNWGEFVCQQMTQNRGYKNEFIEYLNAK